MQHTTLVVPGGIHTQWHRHLLKMQGNKNS